MTFQSVVDCMGSVVEQNNNITTLLEYIHPPIQGIFSVGNCKVVYKVSGRQYIYAIYLALVLTFCHGLCSPNPKIQVPISISNPKSWPPKKLENLTNVKFVRYLYFILQISYKFYICKIFSVVVSLIFTQLFPDFHQNC